MNRILVLENLCPNIQKKHIQDTLSPYSMIENILIYQLRLRKFALVFLKEAEGAKKLMEK